ncbi:MAG TPA: hypothetical protein VHB69_01225 [Mycobacteriales bacterium]|nr:hypothetical protein [Mycobacteriales bacterium]
MKLAQLGGVAAGATAVLLVSGCGGGSTPSPSSHPVTARPAAAVAPVTTGCTGAMLPKGFTVDAAHTGKLTAHNYSATADVQAALEYDQMTDGGRDVWLKRAKSGRITQVASCIAMPFPSAHIANRFFMSYRQLRTDAGSIVHRIALPKPVAGLAGVTAYLETQQSFRGYHIASTNVIEAAGRDGSRLDIVSVAGSSPSAALAQRLLAAMAGAA